MTPIGFNISASRMTQQEEKTLEDIEILLEGGASTAAKFEELINRELLEIQDIQKNFTTISEQMKSIRMLFTTRKDIVKDFFAEQHKRPSEIDVKKCKKCVVMLQKIDETLAPMIQSVYREAMRLHVDETHLLYKQSKENRNIMHKVDKQMRTITRELNSMQRQLQSDTTAVEQLYKNIIEAVAAERAARISQEKIGFRNRAE